MPSKALLWRQYYYFSKSQQSLDCHFCYLQDGVRFSIPGLLSVVTIIHRTTGMIFIKPHHSNGLQFCNSPSSISCGSDPRTDLRIMCFLELAHFDAQSPLHTQALYQSCRGGQHLLPWPSSCSMCTFANNPYFPYLNSKSFSHTPIWTYIVCVSLLSEHICMHFHFDTYHYVAMFPILP